MNFKEKTRSFLEIAPQFGLGHLTTESFHQASASLSETAKLNLSEAFKILEQIDHSAITVMQTKAQVLWGLAQEIVATLDSGNKIFLCGCGATGRLSLVLETLYHQKFGHSENVISFMAGGDYALIKSVESFEDRTDYGQRQLSELGFGQNDLLLASTEGGETPFVIGATKFASIHSQRKPFFLYCNPDDLLSSIERSKEIILHPRVRKINLTVGPMAISGSTRMQASTVLMLAIGVGLLYRHQNQESFETFYFGLLNDLQKVSYEALSPLTKAEAKLYEENKFVNYLSGPELAISVLTDTTERSPTFSLKGFENRTLDKLDHSLSYLFVENSSSSEQAWLLLLGRKPRALEWSDLTVSIGEKTLSGFDISSQGMSKRSQEVNCEEFKIEKIGPKLLFQFMEHQVSFDVGTDKLKTHLILKMLLNSHSTLIMALLNRYEGNVMTYVRPSNNKLIDRAARYAMRILEQKGKKVPYEKVVEKIFEIIESKEEGAVVLKVVQAF